MEEAVGDFESEMLPPPLDLVGSCVPVPKTGRQQWPQEEQSCFGRVCGEGPDVWSSQSDTIHPAQKSLEELVSSREKQPERIPGP